MLGKQNKGNSSLPRVSHAVLSIPLILGISIVHLFQKFMRNIGERSSIIVKRFMLKAGIIIFTRMSSERLPEQLSN